MICDTCNAPIEGKSITAMGKNYHPGHFLCSVCERPITEKTFHQQDGKPVCQKDYEATCPVCASCLKPISENMIIANEKHYHANHFKCYMCKQQITDGAYHERDGNIFCHTCFLEKLADKCKACGEPIESRATVALSAKWHPDCFKCKSCDKVINTTSFKVSTSGDPICESC